jgi:hypothetical protein
VVSTISLALITLLSTSTGTSRNRLTEVPVYQAEALDTLSVTVMNILSPEVQICASPSIGRTIAN